MNKSDDRLPSKVVVLLHLPFQYSHFLQSSSLDRLMYISADKFRIFADEKSQSQQMHTSTHTSVYEFSIIRGGSTVAHKMSGGAHEKPCTHIPISELFAKKKSRTTPVEKSNVLMPQISFPCPGFGPLLYRTPSNPTVTSVCLHPAYLYINSDFQTTYVQRSYLRPFGYKFCLSHCAIVGPLGKNSASPDPGISL